MNAPHHHIDPAAISLPPTLHVAVPMPAAPPSARPNPPTFES